MAGIEEAFEKFSNRLAREESKRYTRDIHFSSKYISINDIKNSNAHLIVHAASILDMILKFNNPMLKLEHIKIFSISVFKKLLINVISNEFEKNKLILPNQNSGINLTSNDLRPQYLQYGLYL